MDEAKADDFTVYATSNAGKDIEVKEVRLSENLVLGIRTTTEKEEPMMSFNSNILSRQAKTSTYKVSSMSYIKHITGLYNLVTCNAVGCFKSNGKPISASPTFSSRLWQVDTSSSIDEPYVNCYFDCTYYIGVDPVGMELQSTLKSCALWFNSSTKEGHASWD